MTERKEIPNLERRELTNADLDAVTGGWGVIVAAAMAIASQQPKVSPSCETVMQLTGGDPYHDCPH